MNRVLFYIVTIVIVAQLGCDTKDNIQPRNEDFFVKMYDGIQAGNQYGADIIETSDGGLLIAGTGGEYPAANAEILLIKTNAKGDIVWKFGASQFFGPNVSSEAKSLIEVQDGYIVGGNIYDGTNRGILLKIGEGPGTGIDTAMIRTLNSTSSAEDYGNTLKKISLGNAGVMVAGETEEGGRLGINGYLSFYSTDLTNIPIPGSTNPIVFFGGAFDDFVTGGYEVVNPAESVGSDASRYLVFGYSQDASNPGNGLEFYCYGFQDDIAAIAPVSSFNPEPGDQIAHNSTRFSDNFFVIGQSESLDTYIAEWKFNGTVSPNWTVRRPATINTGITSIGKGIAIRNLNDITMVSDQIYNPGEQSDIQLAKLSADLRPSNAFDTRNFGTTTSTYTSANIVVLQNGSLVIIGTADLDPIKKILVIKTGPNGEMSF